MALVWQLPNLRIATEQPSIHDERPVKCPASRIPQWGSRQHQSQLARKALTRVKNIFAILSIVGLAASASAQDARVVVTSATVHAQVQDIKYGTNTVNADVEAITTDPNTGTVYFTNTNATNDSDGFAIIKVVSPDSSPVVSRIATTVTLANAMTAAGGTFPLDQNFDVRSLGVNSNGDVIIVFDTTTPANSYMFRVASNGSGATVIAGRAATDNRIDGHNAMAVSGRFAYVFRNSAFALAPNSPADEIVAFDTVATADPTTQGVVVVNEAALLAATGQTQANLVINSATLTSGGNIAFTDSGAASSNDNFYLLNTSTNAVSALKTKATILTDLTLTDLQSVTIAANPANGDIFVQLGNSTAPTTDGNGLIRIAAGNGTATRIVSEAQILADSDVAAFSNASPFSLSTNTQGIAFGNSNKVYISEEDLEKILSVQFGNNAGVNDWMMY